MKSLQDSPKPLFPLESRTPPASQGFSTCSEDTDVEKSSTSEPAPAKAGDFSSLKFGDDAETKESTTPDKEDISHPIPSLSGAVNVTQNQDVRSQNTMQTFGYQQRMSFNVEHGFGPSPQKPSRNKKKKKKWNQAQNFNFQQQGRNIPGPLDNNFGNFNMNPQTNFGPQQNMNQWRGPSQNAPPNYQGNKFYCGGPTIGQDQGPRPQHINTFVGSFTPQGPSVPNFNVPPPNMPPMEFFRKVPPPNFQQHNQPMIPQQPQQSPHIPPHSVPPPPLQGNQSQFFSPSQPPPYTRLPPPPPFQANVSTPPPSQFPQPNIMPQQQLPARNMQPGFPPQQNQYSYSSPPPPQLSVPPAQQISPPGKLPIPLQHQSSLPEAVTHPEGASFSHQTGAVTTSSTATYESGEGFAAEPEPCTPSPLKHKPAHLPPHWKSATDQQGKVYYYHALTRLEK